MNLKERNILLTGARRIGQSVAGELCRRGANLAVVYRSSKEEAEAVCSECQKQGTRSIIIQAELSNEEDIKRVVGQTKREFERIDGLVHMAAPYPRTPWEILSEKDWDQSFDAIAKSAFLLGLYVGRELLKNPGEVKGKIIFFSDWSVNRKPYKDYLPYNAAKGAVETLTRSLAIELAPSITVNCIAPGPILRPPDLSPEEEKEALSGTPLGRWGGAEEIAKAVIYLLEADFVTGVVLPVDGGRSIG